MQRERRVECELFRGRPTLEFARRAACRKSIISTDLKNPRLPFNAIKLFNATNMCARTSKTVMTVVSYTCMRNAAQCTCVAEGGTQRKTWPGGPTSTGWAIGVVLNAAPVYYSKRVGSVFNRVRGCTAQFMIVFHQNLTTCSTDIDYTTMTATPYVWCFFYVFFCGVLTGIVHNFRLNTLRTRNNGKSGIDITHA